MVPDYQISLISALISNTEAINQTLSLKSKSRDLKMENITSKPINDFYVFTVGGKTPIK